MKNFNYFNMLSELPYGTCNSERIKPMFEINSENISAIGMWGLR